MLIILTAMCFGDFIQIGNANIIDDPENESHGLAFLDTSLSVGLTLDIALDRSPFLDTRLATPSEIDDLFLAAGATYDVPDRPRDAFSPGELVRLYTRPTGGPSDILIDVLGPTQSTPATGDAVFLWTDPFNDETRDMINVHRLPDGTNSSVMSQTTILPGDALDVYVAWPLVTRDAGLFAQRNVAHAAIPEPSAFALFVVAIVLVCFVRKHKYVLGDKL